MRTEATQALIRLADHVISSDVRATLRALPGELVKRAPLWRQRLLLLEGPEIAPFRVGFAGDPSLLTEVTDLLRLREAPPTRPLGLDGLRDGATAVFADWPMPGSMRVPVLLRTYVPLEATLEATVAGFEPELRRRMRRLAERSKLTQVTEADAAVRLHRGLMDPFARSRHGDRADLVGEDELVRLAREQFLGAVALDGCLVAAQTGHSYQRHGARCWEALRFGYPEDVFSDPHRLSDANTLNAFWAIRHAIDTGHAMLDFGTSVAAPEGGLLQFKRRRGGLLSVFGCLNSVWLKVPDSTADTFFWRWPLFSVEHQALVLHLGVPAEVPDLEVMARLKALAYRGLEAVRLHVGRPVEPALHAAAIDVFRSAAGAVHGKGSARRIEVTRAA